jgi:ADP-ribose pyrophosphatase YjhB (NUDIX family)
MLDDKTYQFVYSKCIRLCIDLIIDTEHGVLLGKRAHEPFIHTYALPGGGMKFGESLFDAAHRICKKELNSELQSIKLFDVMEFPEEIELSNRHSISLAVIAKISKRPSLANKETFLELTSSELVKPSLVLPKHYKTIQNFYGE